MANQTDGTRLFCQIFEMDPGGVGVKVPHTDENVDTSPLYHKIYRYQQDTRMFMKARDNARLLKSD